MAHDELLTSLPKVADGIILFAVGLPHDIDGVNQAVLDGIGNDPDTEYVFVPTPEQLATSAFSDMIASQVCAEEVPLPPPTPTPNPTSQPDPSSPGITINVPPIVFSNSFGGDSEIYKASLLSYTQLTNNSFEDVNPAYSPDGQKVVFQSYRNGAWQIYRINADGTSELALTTNGGIEPDWYPDGSAIVFARGSELYRINADGTGETQLTNHGSGEAHNPAMSNNGRWIVYEQGDALYIIDGTCTSTCPFTQLSLPVYGFAEKPAWSPDDSQIVFDMSDDLLLMDVDYSQSPPNLINPNLLTDANSLFVDTNPTWTDNQTILFESNRDGSNSLYAYTLSNATASSAQTFSIETQQETGDGGAAEQTDNASNPDGVVAQATIPLCPELAIVQAFPGTTNEASDMLSIANANGLILHDGPTINARRLGIDGINTIPWGATIKADAYITFEQTDANGLPINDQLWYRVTEFTIDSVTYTWNESDDLWSDGTTAQTAFIELLNQAQDVWINARTENYFYMSGVNENLNPCLGDINDITGSSTETITFSYDRRAAAEYAIAHAYRNSISIPPYPNEARRATNRLENPAIEIEIGIPIPFALQIPYSQFRYQSYSGSLGNTASALFPSEALWIGGMPMTYRNNIDGTTAVGTGCLDVDANGQVISNNFNISGWRYCDNESLSDRGGESGAWRGHVGLVAYYSDGTSFGAQNSVIDTTQHGEEVALFYILDPQSPTNVGYDVTQAFSQFADGDQLRNEGILSLDTPQVQIDFYDLYINPSPSVQNQNTVQGITDVQIGDYIYIERGANDVFGHGFYIVGWGAISSCPTSLNKVWTYDIPSNSVSFGQLYPTFGDANDQPVIPYVVDHPGMITPFNSDYSPQLQRPRPRPFYCARFANPTAFSTTSPDGFAFYTFTNMSTITIRSEQLYVSPNWHWE